MYEVVLFDMDGVVIDTHQSVTDYWLTLAEQHSVTLTDEHFNQAIYGVPTDQTFDAFFPFLTAAQRQSLHEDIVRYEAEQTYIEVKGVTALLKGLRQAGIPTALVTSAKHEKVAIVFDQLGLGELFTTTV